MLITIITHSGSFHADEVLACGLMKTLFPNSSITRTRDAKLIENGADFVIDVGGVYDRGRGLFDHHQENPPVRNDGTPYSSFGLVWNEYGLEYIKALFPGIDESIAHSVKNSIDSGFVHEIDRNDVGLMPVPSTHIASIIKNMNETSTFDEAMALGHVALSGLALKYKKVHEAKPLVESAMKNMVSDGAIELPYFLPWQRHVNENVFFAIIQDKETGLWYVQTKKDKKGDIAIPLAEEWRGMSHSQLDSISYPEGMSFVHNTGFIGAAKTRQGAIDMAVVSLAISCEKDIIASP